MACSAPRPGRVEIDHGRRIGAGPGPVVAGDRPEVAGLGPPAPRIEHRRPGLVHEQLGRALEVLEQPLVQGAELGGGAADPVRQRRAIELDALPGVDLALAIERQVVGVFADQDMGDQRLGRQPALDQPRRRRRLDHGALAGAAAILGPAGDDHPELRPGSRRAAPRRPRRSGAARRHSRGRSCSRARSPPLRAAGAWATPRD